MDEPSASSSNWLSARLAWSRPRLVLLLALALAFALPGTGRADHKRVFMAPDDHTDYFWSATADEYSVLFTEMLDYYLDQADATAAEPSAYESRFSADGSLWLREYAKNKTPADFQRLVEGLKSGHISSPLNPLVVTYGGVPVEAVIRSMYYAGQLERRYALDFPLAIAMENAGMAYGLGSVWAGAGAEYSWKGVCNCPSQVPSLGNRTAEIYNWVGPDDSRILMKWNSLHDPADNESIGGYAEARSPSAALDLVTTNAAANGFAGRYPYNTIGVFGQGWDDLSTRNLNVQQTCKLRSDTTRTCIVSDTVDFFREFDTLYGHVIPTVSASFGNEWDLAPASLAEVSARVKRSLEALRSAEALATLVALRNPSFLDGRDTARDQAFLDLGLYFEHDFENGGPRVSGATRIAWQRQVAAEIEAYASTLTADATAALGTMIQRSGTNPRFFVFNSLSWTRTDTADVSYTGALPVHVVDLATGAEVPSQVVVDRGKQYLRVQAPGVPSVGYKVFEIQPGAGTVFANGPTADAGIGVIENELYRLTVSPRGAIASFVDKRRGIDFAGSTGGFALNDLGAATGALAIENAGPVSVTLRATSGSPLAHTTRITLARGSDRVAIQNEITQNFGGTKELRFSVNVPNPDVRHEEVGAIVRARLTTQGGDYSPTNARYDYLTLNHFADMSGSNGTGVTLSNADAYFMRLGNSSVTTLDTATPQLSVLIGGSIRPYNPILNQAGDSYLRQGFALRAHGAYDQPQAMRFALEHQNPLVTGAVAGGNGYPETTYSYLTISDPNVLLWSLKPSDEGIGEGLIARVWNLTATASPFALALNEPIARVRSITHIETDRGSAAIDAGALSATAARNQILSFRLFPSSLPRAVKILPSDARATEAGDPASFTIVRTGDTSQPLDVPYTVDGTASPAADYQALPGVATIPAGADSTVIRVLPVADGVAEPEETIVMTLSPQPGTLLGLWRSATAGIVANSGGTATPPPPSGAVTSTLYPFAEGAGSTTADVSGNGNTGTITAATWAAGKVGPGLRFNGSTSFVAVPDAASLDLGATGTVEAWVRLDALNLWHGIVAKGSANDIAAHNYGLEITSGNRAECGIGNGSSSNSVVSAAALAAGTLYHLACVWTGTQLQIYVNGVLNASGAQTITPLGGNAPLFIGQYGGNADRTNGLIDEVRLFNRARTQAEIQSDMNTPVAPPAVTDTTKPTVTLTAPTGGVVSGSLQIAADAADDVGVAGVQFTVDGATVGAEDAVAPYTAPWDTRTVPNGSHTLSASARDAAGNTHTAADVTVTVSNDSIAPTAPTGPAAIAASPSQVDLSWTGSTDDIGVAGYRVSRNGSAIGMTTATSFSDTGLAPQTAYTYTVAAFDAAGNTSAESAPAAATTPPAPATGLLVAGYPFGEAAGTLTADASGSGNGGTLMYAPMWTTAGKHGSAIDFDGVDDHVRVADSSSLDLGGTGTVEAWVKLDSLGRWQAVVAKGDANLDQAHNYAIEVTKANRWVCILGNGASRILLTSSTAPRVGRYYHVACTWDGTTARLYIDGVPNVSAAQLVTPAPNTSPLYIGQFGGNTDRLDGTIDEVRISNRALSQAEIQNDMSAPL